MFEQFWTITRNTFTEAIRQPIYVVLILAGALMLILNPFLAAYSMEPGKFGDNKMLVDMGLSTLFIVGLLLAAFSATGVMSAEIESRTVLTVVSKPVPRPLVVLGKFVGVVGAISVSYLILAMVFGLTVRHRVMSTAAQDLDGPVLSFGVGMSLVALGVATFGNYFFRWVWASTVVIGLAVATTCAFALVLLVSPEWALQSPLAELSRDGWFMGQTLIGAVLVWFGVIILGSVAVTVSTRLGQVPTVLICVLVFGAGVLSQSYIRAIDNRIGITSEAHFAHSGDGRASPWHRMLETWLNRDLTNSVKMSLERQSDTFTRERFELLVVDVELTEAERDEAFRFYVTERRLPDGIVEELADQARLPFGERVICTAGVLLHWTAPNLQYLWPADAITQGNHISGGYVVRCLIYTLTYVVAVLAIGVALFQRREVG
ncbi:MAG: ABC transporter permease subunit [Planctomycetota bacterium]